MNNSYIEKFRGLAIPTEQEIMASWVNSEPLVSCVCKTYNHEAYVEDAMRSFLTQKTNFPFEIVIHDDASTDNTLQILQKYVDAYPNIIKPVFQKENQYSQGIAINLLAVRYAKGDLIAYCEGDDFWIDPEKLQLQVDALKDYPDCEISFHSAVRTVKEIPDQNLFCKRAQGNKLIDVDPIILDGGAYMPTAAMMIRRSFFDRVFQENNGFYEKFLCASVLQIVCAVAGGALYIDRPMCVYRLFSEGSWTQKSYSNPEAYKAYVQRYFYMMGKVNELTGHRFDQAFSRSFRKYHLSLLNNTLLDLDFRRRYFNEHRPKLGLYTQVLWYCVFQFPMIHSLLKQLRAFVKSLL